MSLLVSLTLGRVAVLLTFLFIAWTEMAVLWNEGLGQVGAPWKSVALIGLPWMLGAGLVESAPMFPVLTALALIALTSLYAHPSPLALLGPPLMAGFLIWQGHSMAAGVLMLLALPGWMLVPHYPSPEIYHRAVAPYLLAMLILLAGVL